MSVTSRPPGGPREWHVAEADLAEYAAGRVSRGDASTEAHLVRCATCRARLRGPAEPTLDRVWDRVLGEVAAPPRLVERLLLRVGVRPGDALLVDAAPALRASWTVGTILSLVFAAGAASDHDLVGLLVFLTLAPLIPVGAVAVAHNPETDPVHEVAAAAPLPRVRLLLVRSLSVVAPALVLSLLAARWLPGPAWVATAWLVPALACATTTLALSTWVDVDRAAAAVAGSWTAFVLVVVLGLREPLHVLDGPALLGYSLTATAMVAVLWRRGDRLSSNRRTA